MNDSHILDADGMRSQKSSNVGNCTGFVGNIQMQDILLLQWAASGIREGFSIDSGFFKKIIQKS